MMKAPWRGTRGWPRVRCVGEACQANHSMLWCAVVWFVTLPFSAQAADITAAMVKKGKGPQQAAAMLADTAYARGSADNICVLVVDVTFPSEG